jgi:hypothetical protein
LQKPLTAEQPEAGIRDLKDQAITFILAPAAAADPAADEAALAIDAAGFAAAGTGCAPMICCSELNKLPKRFCADPTGI